MRPDGDQLENGMEKAEPVLYPRHGSKHLPRRPGRTYTMLRSQVNETRGVFESVSDEEAFRAMHVLAKMEGISAEPAAAVAFAGLFKLVRAGIIKSTDTVVVNCTGHTLPAEQFLFGENWTRDVDLQVKTEQAPTHRRDCSQRSTMSPRAASARPGGG